ncbi:recombinase family protein [Alicyclobacillus sp. ALC3]|uniref:recombinase family protein n=1 Tax=Alicyclobacillus sp. ALC3 TaxID=2796143 RepID=UPI002377E286|nr:recombinase family protein [Alicyclobacillus sp. ALC3]WDL97049.1 recombinase family protein [Alicyclobacillus sp. ALC3]WDL98361.1 recombinase family protein [Alicyclobacillus sp. ALC3]WDL98505.1 recombinase family protein [Alicyclobacillus sp. ALC3]WDL98826.1 recombinase family protein [Alicyclobacillus sp. ALC3]
MTTAPSKVHPEHLNRPAIVYIRQSSLAQVRFHRESTERQYALREKAIDLGWAPEQIQVIDEDLGISGSGRSQRLGFQNLVAQVSLGEVGAILGLEISRLARSSADLLRLLELCGLFNTIVVDEDGIYDLRDFNDRLILGFKGTMSEAELHFLRARLIGGKKNKAKKGELRFPLPVGYVYDANGQTVLDPDEEVQTAIHNVFRAFRTTGSAYGVVQFFAQNGLRFPKRAYGGAWAGQLVWGTLNHSRVLGVLYNPAYTGAYVFGRYRDQKRVNPQGLFIHHTVRLPREQWEVFIPDHHPGYVTWEEYERNLKQLHSNRTNLEKSGPAREGTALLQGLVICGKCGRRMSVRYTGNGGISPHYECKGRWEHGHRATCTTVPAPSIDQAISERLLQVIQPAELELALQVMDKLLHEEDDADKGWKLSLERARYEADRAERQYQQVEPENRLVVRSLEARWNEKLTELAQLQEQYTQYVERRSWRPTEHDKVAILSLAKELPRIWSKPSTTFKDRKRILRLMIEDVTIFAEPRNPAVRLGLRWRNQHCEELWACKPLPQHMVVKHSPETVEVVRRLSETMIDQQIAKQLNESGMRTPDGRMFTIDSIKWIRYIHKIPGYTSRRHGLSVKEVAERLRIAPGVVYYWLNRGILSATKAAPGYPWEIHLNEQKELELRERIQKSGHLN